MIQLRVLINNVTPLTVLSSRNSHSVAFLSPTWSSLFLFLPSSTLVSALSLSQVSSWHSGSSRMILRSWLLRRDRPRLMRIKTRSLEHITQLGEIWR